MNTLELAEKHGLNARQVEYARCLIKYQYDLDAVHKESSLARSTGWKLRRDKRFIALITDLEGDAGYVDQDGIDKKQDDIDPISLAITQTVARITELTAKSELTRDEREDLKALSTAYKTLTAKSGAGRPKNRTPSALLSMPSPANMSDASSNIGRTTTDNQDSTASGDVNSNPPTT